MSSDVQALADFCPGRDGLEVIYCHLQSVLGVGNLRWVQESED